MPLRSIPPKTSTGPGRTRWPAKPVLLKPTVSLKWNQPLSKQIKEKKPYKSKPYKKPREWRYVTKPFFAKIKEPLIDVFKEAGEVQIIMDLGGFSRDEISFGLKDNKYIIYGKHGEQEFKKEINLPSEVDLDNVVENFRNNILGLVLARKVKSTKRKKRGKKT